MKYGVARRADPWYPAFLNMSQDPLASASYVMKGPLTFATRNATGPQPGRNEISSDAVAAELNALMYDTPRESDRLSSRRWLADRAWNARFYITGAKTHASKSVEILNGWTNTLQLLNGTDAQLTTALYGPHFVNAADIIRAYYPAWTHTEIEGFKSMILNIFYPPASQTTPSATQQYPL